MFLSAYVRLRARRKNFDAPCVILSPPDTDASDRAYLAVTLARAVGVDNIPTGLVFDDLGGERGPL